jgi:hypothetical protein
MSLFSRHSHCTSFVGKVTVSVFCHKLFITMLKLSIGGRKQSTFLSRKLLHCLEKCDIILKKTVALSRNLVQWQYRKLFTVYTINLTWPSYLVSLKYYQILFQNVFYLLANEVAKEYTETCQKYSVTVIFYYIFHIKPLFLETKKTEYIFV